MRPAESFVSQPVRSLQTMLRVLAEDDPRLLQLLAEGRRHRDAVEHRVDRDLARALDPGEHLLLLDTVPYPSDQPMLSKVSYISSAPVFAEAIRRIYEEVSIANMFEN